MLLRAKLCIAIYVHMILHMLHACVCAWLLQHSTVFCLYTYHVNQEQVKDYETMYGVTVHVYIRIMQSITAHIKYMNIDTVEPA